MKQIILIFLTVGIFISLPACQYTKSDSNPSKGLEQTAQEVTTQSNENNDLDIPPEEPEPLADIIEREQQAQQARMERIAIDEQVVLLRTETFTPEEAQPVILTDTQAVEIFSKYLYNLQPSTFRGCAGTYNIVVCLSHNGVYEEYTIQPSGNGAPKGTVLAMRTYPFKKSTENTLSGNTSVADSGAPQDYDSSGELLWNAVDANIWNEIGKHMNVLYVFEDGTLEYKGTE